MRFTIQRILGIAPVMVVGLLLATPEMGIAQARPDLVVSTLTPPPATGLPGDGFVVTAEVRNNGAVAAGVSITKFDLVSTTGGATKNLKGVQNIADLAPGASSNPAVTLAIYSDTLPGTYKLRACANSVTPKIAESSTVNNCLLSSGTITVFDVPDLEVTAISNPPSSVPQGQPFNATYTVQNTGTAADQFGVSFRVKFYLVFGTTRMDLKTATPEMVGTLGPGAPFTHTLALTVRPETVPGTYALQACADSGKVVTEKDENDNCKTSAGAVQVTPQPDLLVKQVTVVGAPTTVDQGESLDIQVVVRNDGLVDAPASTLKFVLASTGAPLSKNLKGTVAVPGVLKNSEVTLNATPRVYEDTVPGSYTLEACVDSKKVVGERSEGNNCLKAAGTLTVVGVPMSPADLAVIALTPPPATRLPGETFPLTATVKNHGTGASPSSTSKFYLVNALVNPTVRKNLKGVQIIPDGLGANAANATEITVAVYSDTVPGSYFLQACADGEKQLHEINESDNCLTFSSSKITVQPVPDLVITQLGNPPANILPGKSFGVTATVQNSEPVAALASRVKFSLVSTVDATIRIDLNGGQDVPPLPPNGTFTPSAPTMVTVRPETLPGTYRMQACADAGKAVLEGDEDDNCAMSTGSVQVAPVADLIVSAVRLLPPPPVTVARGGTVDLNAIVKNQGLGDAAASSLRFSLVIAVGAAPIKKMPEIVPVVAVEAGGRQPTIATVTIPSSTPVGTYLVQACVDTGNVVVEASDNNNCGTSTLTLEVQ